MKTRLRAFLYLVLFLFTLSLSLMLFCLTSTPGLYLTIKGVQHLLPGHIKVYGLQGRLMDQMSCKKLLYEDKDLKITLFQVSLNWRLSTLLNKELRANALVAEKLLIQRKHPTPAPPVPHLPMAITLQKLQLNHLIIQNPTGRVITLHQLKAHHLFMNAKSWGLREAKIRYQKTEWSASTHGQTIFPFNESLQLQWTPLTPTGGLKGNFSLKGNHKNYHLRGELTTPGIIQFKGKIINLTQIAIKFDWKELLFKQDTRWKFNFSHGDALLQGTWDHLSLQLKTQTHLPIAGKLHLKAQKIQQNTTLNAVLEAFEGKIMAKIEHHPQAQMSWLGELNMTNINLESYAPLHGISLKTQLKGTSLTSLNVQGALKARFYEEQLKAKFSYQPPQIGLAIQQIDNHLNIEGIYPEQWTLQAQIPTPSRLHPALKNLKTKLTLRAKTKNLHEGQLKLTIAPGEYNPQIATQNQPILFQGGDITARLSSKGLMADGKLQIDTHQKLEAHFKLPKFSLLPQTIPNSPVDGEVNLQVRDLSFLSLLIPQMTKIEGEFFARLMIAGQLSHPLLSGLLELHHGKAQLSKLGLVLDGVMGSLKTKDNHWKFKGIIKSNGQPLTLKGEGELTPQTGLVHIEGKNVEVFHVPQYHFIASPRLEFKMAPDNLLLAGVINIPEAEIKPLTFSKTISLSEDVRLIKKDQHQKHFPLSLDILLQTGPKVFLDTTGLKGRLVGEIHLEDTAKSALSATGEVSIVDGQYQAFGQNLIVDHGALTFTGGGIDNPSIELRAIRRFNNTTERFSGSNQLFDFNAENLQSINLGDKITVGIEANGRLNSPKIKLFSIPATLSQADILSLLVLGRPSAQASQAGGQLLITAISSMNLDSGTGGVQLLQQLKQSTGLDFNVQNNPSFNQQTKQISDNTSFVLSKSISNRLLLSYNIGLLGTDNNIFTLRYLLNKFFSLQVNTSDQGSGVDLLYTYSKDSSHD